MLRSHLLLACVLISLLAQGQSEKIITFNTDTTVLLHNVLDDLLDNSLRIVYSKSRIPNRPIQFKSGEYSFSDIIKMSMIEELQLTLRDGTYLLSKKENVTSFQYAGYVRDKQTGEVLIGALVYADTNLFNVSNHYGYFSLQSKRAVDSLSFRFIGYQPTKVSTNQLAVNQNVFLSTIELTLDDIVIPGMSSREHQMQLIPGSHQIDYDRQGDIPYFMGEVDVLQETLMLPGIKTLGEDASGIHIRGGNSDQNLILLDEAMIYNPNHFFGLISVFNPEAVNQVDIMKGYIPAEYGTRGSSIISVKQREGNYQKFSGAGGIGLVSGRLLLEGPIKKETASFLFSARQSIFDLSTNRFDRNAIRRSRTSFQDFNLKTNWRVNKKNTLFLSTYGGNDRTKTILEQTNRWGNNTGTLRWNHLWNKRLFSNLTAVFSDYNYRAIDPIEVVSFIGRAEIRNINVKYNFAWTVSEKSEIKWGTQLLWHKLSPGDIQPFDTLSSTIPTVLEVENGLEHGSYLSHKWNINKSLQIDYGLRFSGISTYGPGPVYEFASGMERAVQNIIDTTRYAKNEIIDQFLRLEPRILLNWSPIQTGVIKTSFTRSHQYLQLISTSVIPSPTDLWKLSNRYLQPLTVDHISTGYYHLSKNKEWNLSVEAYYKRLKNLIEYKNGADLLLNPLPETELLSAEGRSYGIELLAKKNGSHLSGWISYTLSRSERRVLTRFDNLQINNGAFYPDNHDRLHDLTAVAKYQLNKHWSFSSALYYSTGRPISFPTGKYQIDGKLVTDYGNRNQDRISDYHRMDISARWTPRPKLEKRWQHSWSANIYNVYARQNAYTYLFRASEIDPGQTEVVSYSLFGTIIPSLTYDFSF